MSKSFDPYYKWLGIRDPERPPNHYRLLGVEMFESNIDVITTAADRQMAHLRTYRHGKNNELSERLLNEVSAAKVCLSDPGKKASYDESLRVSITPDAPPVRPPDSVGPITLDEDDVLSRSGRAKRRRWPSRYVSTLVLVVSIVTLGALLFVQYGPFANVPTALPDDLPDPPVTVTNDDGAERDEPPQDGPPPDEDEDVTPEVVEVEPTEAETPAPVRQVIAAPWTNRNDDGSKRPRFSPAPPAGGVLQAISQRKLEPARKMLATMQQNQPLRNRDRVDELSLVLYTIDRFWAAFDEALSATQVGDVVNYRQQPTRVASIGLPTQIELEAADGQRKTFGLRRATVDRDLAIGFVERRFEGSPATAWRLIGLFLSVDLRGNVDTGREYVARAELHGFEGTYLLQALDDLSQQTDRRVVTVTVDQGEEQGKGKIPIPAEAQQEEKRRELRASGLPERNATKWIETAKRTDDDDVARYVLLAEAARIALADGDVESGMRSLELLDEHYAVEIWNLRYDLIQKLIRKEKGASRRYLANRALQLSHQAVLEDNYSEADRFVELSINIARKMGDKLFRDMLVRTRKRIQQIEEVYTQSRAAAKMLTTKPDDPAANTQVGEFLCFAKGDFVAGLPRLRNGQDAAMRKLATRDLTSPRNSEERIQLGDDWRHHAESLRGLYQLHAIQRARHWYVESLRWLQGEPAVAVQNKLNEIAAVVGREEHVLDATQLYPVASKVGYGKIGINENPNLSYTSVRDLPVIGGRKISRYLWTHAPSNVEYEIPQGAKGFSALGVLNADSSDGAQFQVFVDGRRIYSSRTLKSIGQTVEINATLPSNASRIVLTVDSLESFKDDQTYWVDPVFVF